MSAPKALLVDLDGTLVDTSTANYLAYAEALAAAGVTVRRERWDEVAEGRNWRDFLPTLLREAPGAEPEQVAAHKARLYPAKLAHSFVNEALAALIRGGRAGWRTALVTTASAANAAAVLRHHRLEDLFDLLVTGSDVERHKPFPDAYRLAAQRLGVEARDCLAFEDSDIGVAAALAFGAPCLRVSFAGGTARSSTGY
ncbi:MAG TPA: HAD family phosphatase [Allosphingosinicella sp.]|nr:HAD family phosphatase [Allosphingosinicella sp.]